MRLISRFAPIVALCVATNAAWAQNDAQQQELTPPGSVPPEKFEEAQRRYKKAIELFNDGSYDASLLEFRRAYELAPSYRIYYNIALVNVQIKDYAAAMSSFEKYLSGGGDEVPELRRKEVERELERLRANVGHLTVKANVGGAQVSVDDLVVGRTPLPGPIRVNAGRRRITVAATGKLPSSRVTELAGGDSVVLTFELYEPTTGGAGGPTPATPGPDKPTPAKTEKSFPWVAWAGTAVLAVGAGVTGFLAYRANQDLADERASYDADPNDRAAKQDELESLESKRDTFALTADILTGAAVVMGGISLYLTLSDSGSNETGAAGRGGKLEVGVGPTGLDLRGNF